MAAKVKKLGMHLELMLTVPILLTDKLLLGKIQHMGDKESLGIYSPKKK